MLADLTLVTFNPSSVEQLSELKLFKLYIEYHRRIISASRQRKQLNRNLKEYLKSKMMISSAAHLVGVGMQAVGLSIPVSETSAKVIDGMRDFGIPVPPNTWFKRKGSKDDDKIVESSEKSPKSPKKDIYDRLEGHVQGVIKVVRPVIELKQMIREGCCKSADRPRRARSPSPSKLKYYTPENKKSCSHGEFEKQHKPTSPKKKSDSTSNKSSSRRNINTNKVIVDTAASVVFCMYCSKSRSLLELPCGRQICSKCDITKDHELEFKMPRPPPSNPSNLKNERETIDVIPNMPVDFIDLTQDSPRNTGFRLSRAHAGHDVQMIAEPSGDESVIVTGVSGNVPVIKKPRLQKPTIINLDETVSVDDNFNNATNQKTVTPRKTTLSCPICLENLAEDNITPMTTPCGHVYCLDCLKKVTAEKKKCSLCQRVITFAKCIRLHI